MPDRRSWTYKQLEEAVNTSKSYRQVIIKLGLIPAGGNYVQVQNRVKLLKLNTDHFLGMGWNLGIRYKSIHRVPLKELLKNGSTPQSYKLKIRLFESGLKQQRCELCGWAESSIDGRIPVELGHINGNHNDNGISNLRILCPNCHSLQATHRGKNKGSYKHGRVL
ncbi:MAG: hypothetical protein ACYCPS_04020 [Candidatus Saccharimonadales bacterium]